VYTQTNSDLGVMLNPQVPPKIDIKRLSKT